MKPYINPKGKGWAAYIFEDKVPKRVRRTLKKSARQQGKKELQHG